MTVSPTASALCLTPAGDSRKLNSYVRTNSALGHIARVGVKQRWDAEGSVDRGTRSAQDSAFCETIGGDSGHSVGGQSTFK